MYRKRFTVTRSSCQVSALGCFVQRSWRSMTRVNCSRTNWASRRSFTGISSALAGSRRDQRFHRLRGNDFSELRASFLARRSCFLKCDARACPAGPLVNRRGFSQCSSTWTSRKSDMPLCMPLEAFRSRRQTGSGSMAEKPSASERQRRNATRKSWTGSVFSFF